MCAPDVIILFYQIAKTADQYYIIDVLINTMISFGVCIETVFFLVCHLCISIPYTNNLCTLQFHMRISKSNGATYIFPPLVK